MELFNTQFLTFIAVTLVLTVTPGVDTFIVMRNVLRGGKKDGVITSLGICSGLFVHASLSALGISIILVRSAALFSFIKTAGALYLIWLGISSIYDSFRNNKRLEIGANNSANNHKIYPTKSFREGLFSNVLNPKPALFYLAFFPQFISPTDPVFLKSMILASVQFSIGVAWLSLLSLLISKTKDLLEKPLVNRLMKATSGFVLILFGLKLGLEKN